MSGRKKRSEAALRRGALRTLRRSDPVSAETRAALSDEQIADLLRSFTATRGWAENVHLPELKQTYESWVLALRELQQRRATPPACVTPPDVDSRMQDAFFAGVVRAGDPRPIHLNYAAWKRGEKAR